MIVSEIRKGVCRPIIMGSVIREFLDLSSLGSSIISANRLVLKSNIVYRTYLYLLINVITLYKTYRIIIELV